MRVLFLGEPDNHVNVTAQNARAFRRAGVDVAFDDGSAWFSAPWREACRNTDLIHLISYSQNDPWFFRKLWVARCFGVPIARLWVGTDVLWARNYAPARRFARALSAMGAGNFTVAGHLADKLRKIHVRAEVIPIIADFVSPQAPPPLPEKPAVLAYLSSDYRRDFYGGRIVDELIRRRPELSFLIVHDPDTDYSMARNVESVGTVGDMTPIYERSTILLRPTAHDGMPRMMLEALSFGRHVICSHKYPHCVHATDVDGYLRAIDAILSRPESNEAGRQFVLRNFERRRACEATLDRFRSMLRVPRGVRIGLGTAGALMALITDWPVWLGKSYVPPESDGALARVPQAATRPAV